MAFQKRNDLPSHLKKQARGVFLKLVVQGLITEAVGLLLYEQRAVVACMAKLTVLGFASDVSYLDSSLAQSLHSGAPCWAGPHPKWRYRDLTSIPHCLSLHRMTHLLACSFFVWPHRAAAWCRACTSAFQSPSHQVGAHGFHSRDTQDNSPCAVVCDRYRHRCGAVR